jgi:cell wall-associated NlpC family hydrolase
VSIELPPRSAHGPPGRLGQEKDREGRPYPDPLTLTPHSTTNNPPDRPKRRPPATTQTPQTSSRRTSSNTELKAGDLVFFYNDLHHVGMYVGGGWMVHASTFGEPVQMKKIDSAPIAGYGRVA